MLDDRKAAILRAIVEEYVATGTPVGSAAVAEKAHLGVSAATVRNEMMVLEAQGYISQPHTSAGRVPTDTGYRYFVDNLSARALLPGSDRAAVTEFFTHAHRELEDLLTESSRLLSRITAYAGIVGGPQRAASRVRDAHLVTLSATTVLAIVVMSTGRVDKLVLENVAITEDDIRFASSALAEALRGRSVLEAADTGSIPATGQPAADELVRRVVGELAVRGPLEQVFVGGVATLASADVQLAGVSGVLDALERQADVVALLADALEQASVVVRIGSENAEPAFRDWSVVTASYETDGQPSGAVAVVGPTRMNYARAISAVEAVSAGLGAMFGTLSDR